MSEKFQITFWIQDLKFSSDLSVDQQLQQFYMPSKELKGALIAETLRFGNLGGNYSSTKTLPLILKVSQPIDF